MSCEIPCMHWQCLAPRMSAAWGACLNCGNDDPCEGYHLCSDCLEEDPDGGE